MFREDKAIKLRNIISFLCFIIIVIVLLNKGSWLFRASNYSNSVALKGFANEDHINVVFIGGSNVRCGIRPMDGWKQYGITAYNYATDAAKLDLFKYYIEEIEKTNETDLYVIDIRTLPLVVEDIEEMAVRNWADSYNIWDIDRIKGTYSYLSKRNSREEDVPSYFLDIIKYHEQYDMLKSEAKWKMMLDCSTEDITNGMDTSRAVCQINAFEVPIISENKKELTSIQENSLNELLDFCDKKKIKVLFTVLPYVISDDDYGIYNSAKELIENKGFDFVNFNNNDEIGIDYSHDFCDRNHTNYFGATKLTDYIFEYISESYSFAPQTDVSLAKWNNDYAKYTDEISGIVEYSNECLQECERAVADEYNIIDSKNLSAWFKLVSQDIFTIVFVKNGDVVNNGSDYILNNVLEILSWAEKDVQIWNGDELANINYEEGPFTVGRDRNPTNIKVCVDVDKMNINIDNNGSYLVPAGSLKAFGINNHLRKVVDEVSLVEDGDGNIVLIRGSSEN